MVERRMTEQKKSIIDLIYNDRNHYTADEIYDLLSKKTPNISRATVFRNLNILVEDNVIIKLKISGSANRYDVNDDHYHTKCIKCGKVDDVDSPYLTEINNYFNDLNIINHELLLKIVCDNCQRKED